MINLFSKLISQKFRTYILALLVMLLVSLIIYRYLQTDIYRVKEDISSQQKKLLEYKKSARKVVKLKSNYKSLVKMDQDIIDRVHLNITEHNIKLQKIHHKKIGKDLKVSLVIISSFKKFHKFCQGLIDSLNYRPEVVSIFISNNGDMKLKTKIKLSF